MSYANAGKPQKRSPNSPSADTLLNKELKDQDMAIQSLLTKFKQSLRTLQKDNEKIGSEEDNYDWRKGLLNRMREVKEQAVALNSKITDYGNISVAFAM